MPARFPAGRALRLLAASLVVTGVLAGPGSAGASGSSCQNWTGVPPPNPGTANVLNGVAVGSACDAWAVGNDGSAGASQTLILHWNGTSWTRVASPIAGTDNVLNGVQAASRTDIWAVGSYTESGGAEKTLALHWNGTFWKQVATPNPQFRFNHLSGVRVLSANDAWAVGSSVSGNQIFKTLILHWNGTAWKRVPSPSPPGASLGAVAATSAGNAWAVGYRQGLRTLILHWNGTKWTQVSSPRPGLPGYLTGVSAKSTASAWAVGVYLPGTVVPQTLILHWNGARWTRVASPNPGGPAHDNSLSGVAVTSAGNAWAVGS